jgi:hypothetical protein
LGDFAGPFFFEEILPEAKRVVGSGFYQGASFFEAVCRQHKIPPVVGEKGD